MIKNFELKNKLLGSRLFKDSFWAVFGNGLGNALMLLAGILIARFLGKDLYGEYGVVKTTMFYIASFATFGLGFTSTKYVAQYVAEQKQYIKCIIHDSMIITLLFSGLIALLLVVFAQDIANYVEEPSLKLAFQALAGVIVFKAITTTQIGLLSGYKAFRTTAINSFTSGIFMLIICVPLTYFLGLKGSLLALLMSQAFNALINYVSIRKVSRDLPLQEKKEFKRELVSFSFPVALQESSFTVCHWAAIMLLTKCSSAGELGLYSAAAQWNSIILMIPTLLSNVVLSYLSSSTSNAKQHNKTVNKMLLINLVTTIIPFAIVFSLADFATLFYGATFYELPALLRVTTFTTILESCTSVFKSELMAQSRTWLLFLLRAVRDALFVSIVFVIFSNSYGNRGAIDFAWCSVCVSIIFFITMWFTYSITKQKD